MNHIDENTVSQLDELPNIGKAIAMKLQSIGIKHPKQLIGKDPFELHAELCLIKGQTVDPCIIDVFMAAIHFMEHGETLPWWSFTKERKRIRQNQRSETI